ncbi:MAG: DUF445 family protein [Nitrospinae bacterium]|nr:DUF445 family protein [Nitrospinota bacterium]
MNSSIASFFQILLYGFIGYSTNWLALKMLFFPYTKKRIASIPVPLTPGLIPKERERLANSIGKVVANRLLTKEDLNKAIDELKLNKKISNALIEVIKEKFFLKAPEKEKSLPETFFDNFVHSIRNSTTVESAVLDKLQPFIEKKSDEIIKQYSPKIIDGIDIEKLVIDKINALEIEEVENIIQRTVSKELGQITYVGGAIGIIIGCIQVFVFE